MKNFFCDLFAGIYAWRKWYLLGTKSIRSRYARSKLGQFWPSLSYLITVLSLGLVYAYLWHAPVKRFLPFLSISHVFWTLISTSVVEGCRVFIDSESIIKTEYHPRSMFVLGLLAGNLTYFFHNVVVLIPLLMIFPERLAWVAILAIPGFFLVLTCCYAMAMFVGFFCARYRDLPNVVASFMQILFFVTPVVWESDRLSNPWAKLVLTELNPFAALLAIVRDPLIGTVPTVTEYAVVILWTVFVYAGCLVIFNRGSRRLAYWL